MVFFYASILLAATAVFTCTGILLVSATPIAELRKKAFYFPVVIAPDATTHWAIGYQASVTWDASKVPSDADDLPWVQLYNTGSWGGANYIATLASNFSATAGSVSFSVPDVTPGSYFIMLGEYGQSSPHFVIDASPIPVSSPVETPTFGTVWTVGSIATVTWDTAHVDGTADVPYADLYKTSSYGSAEFVTRLAENFPASTGSVSITVPDVDPEADYFVMLGAYANSSPRFTIQN